MIKSDKLYTYVEDIGLFYRMPKSEYMTQLDLLQKSRIENICELSSIFKHRSGKFWHKSAEFSTYNDFSLHVWLPAKQRTMKILEISR